MVKLSAVIITYNEEKNILSCLESLLKVADEIIVVDSFSTDSTPIICQNFRVTFVQRHYIGQIDQKRYALSLTNNDHVIALDGDEVLTLELIESILEEKKKGFLHSGYRLNRKSFYCGKWINYGDWSPDWKMRLWNKKNGTWGGIGPHDRVEITSGSITKLKGELLHYTFETKAEHLAQIEKYSTISAHAYAGQEIKYPGIKKRLSPVFYLLKNYIIKLGFMDGKLGWQITRLSMKDKFLKYQKLQLLYQSAVKKAPHNH